MLLGPIVSNDRVIGWRFASSRTKNSVVLFMLCWRVCGFRKCGVVHIYPVIWNGDARTLRPSVKYTSGFLVWTLSHLMNDSAVCVPQVP